MEMDVELIVELLKLAGHVLMLRMSKVFVTDVEMESGLLLKIAMMEIPITMMDAIILVRLTTDGLAIQEQLTNLKIEQLLLYVGNVEVKVGRMVKNVMIITMMLMTDALVVK